MKNKVVRLIGVLTVSAALFATGCSKTVNVNINTRPLDKEDDAEKTIVFDNENTEETYRSDRGWSVIYDPSVITVNEGEDMTAFVYTGDSAGTNMLTVSYTEGNKPEEAIDELAAGWGSDIQKSESYFPGTSDKWGYWRTLIAGTEGSGLSENAFAGEYNGGVLMFEFTNHYCGDEGVDGPVRTTLTGIMDSITYDDFAPQTMYEGIAGVYTRTETEEIEGEEVSYVYSVTLNDDHSGEISLQDDLYVMWGSHVLIQADNSYDYTIEGDVLKLNMDGDWLEFKKGGEEAESKDSVLPSYEYTGDNELYAAVYDYIVKEFETYYEKADVGIPCVIIIDTDESDPDDIRVWGDFWYNTYDLDGETLFCKAGGDYPGCIHLKQTDSGYEVSEMEIVGDGSENIPSAKKIFGERYEAYEAVVSDTDNREKVRKQIISDYVKANSLKITAYQDYGWDPVEL